jgi:hypothetical protein
MSGTVSSPDNHHLIHSHTSPSQPSMPLGPSFACLTKVGRVPVCVATDKLVRGMTGDASNFNLSSIISLSFNLTRSTSLDHIMPHSPLQPVPYRQLSYTQTQRELPLLPPPRETCTRPTSPQPPVEAVDDGGWGADSEHGARRAKMRKRREKSGSLNTRADSVRYLYRGRDVVHQLIRSGPGWSQAGHESSTGRRTCELEPVLRFGDS